MFSPRITIVEDIDPEEKYDKGRRCVIIYENTPIDSNAVIIEVLDFEMLYKKYVKKREALGDVRCDKCGHFSNKSGYCQGCSKQLRVLD